MIVDRSPIPYAKANARFAMISPVSITSISEPQAPIPSFYYLIENSAPIPSFCYLSGNSARGWQIAQPLFVKVEQTDGKFVTSQPRLNIYGVGKTYTESITDFTSMLVDLFEELSASEDVLSHHLRQQLEILRSILVPC